MMDMSDSQLVIIGIKCVQKKLQNVGPMSLSKDHTVDVYRYKTIESIGNSFVTFTKGISYRFYRYYL